MILLILFLSFDRGLLKRVEKPLSIKSCFTERGYNVIHYDIFLYKINEEEKSIEGKSSILIESQKNNLDTVYLHLAKLKADSIKENSKTLSFLQQGDSIIVFLSSSKNLHDTFKIDVYYSGNPAHELSFGGFWFSYRTIYTMGVGLYTDPPSMARYWFACVDEPADKATADIYITVDKNKIAVSNGELVEEIEEPEDKKTYHWKESHPVSTYLLSIAISDYIVFKDSLYDWIYHYIHPEYIENAKVSFKNVHLMMETFTHLFSPYPFEKFSFVATPKGDMEHVTAVSHLETLIDGTNTYDYILAHELSHHWWGNWVTIKDWKDIWLNEGFATYCEALYEEYINGREAYNEYIKGIMDFYLRSGELFPIYAPQKMWGATTYEKGASVLHMLRYITGDSNFFKILKTYGERFGFKNVTTEDFKNVCEEIYKENLDWFFDEWVYDWGYPVFEYTWKKEYKKVYVKIKQVQEIGPLFKMPVELLFKDSVKDTVIKVWVENQVDSFTFTLSFVPDTFKFDPNNYILKKATYMPYGIEEKARQFFVKINSFIPEIRIHSPEPTDVCINIYDASGRKIQTLYKGPLKGYRVIKWRNFKNYSSGIYFIKINTKLFEKTVKFLHI